MIRVYFIMGCTAGGKGAVGRALAEKVGGRVLSVDSMKIYRRMDIGTAKPSAKARAQVPHYGIDIVEPSESFSVAQYVEYADAAIAEIDAAGAPVLAVGGTNLYVKSLSEGLMPNAPADESLRAELHARAEAEGSAALHAELAAVDAAAAERIHSNDRRRIVRALEVYRLTGRPISELQSQWDAGRQRYDCVYLGLAREKEDASARINARAKKMLDLGLVDEVRGLLAEPAGLGPQAAQAVGYAEIIDHLQGRSALDEAFERIKIHTRRLAKSQRTWQRRFRDVHWFDVTGRDDAAAIADEILATGVFG